MKTALITGALGQDGSYLTEYLLDLGYRVFCGVKRSPHLSQTMERATWALKVLEKGVEFLYCDVEEELSVRSAIKKAWPDEIYNLAGQVYVPISWEMPTETFAVNVGGLATILKVVEQMKRDTKVYQASSSEMFGNHDGTCTDETPMNPTSPYGVSKYAAHRLVGLYRNRGLFVVAGILFNHESPRRGYEMVTRKIANMVARWAHGDRDILSLGSTESRRDWGFAGDYVKAMHEMLQYDVPTDYVIGTGESHSVAEFLETACDELGVSKTLQQELTQGDARFLRDQEILSMTADNTKAKALLGWKPYVTFRELVRMMVWSEFNKLLKKREVVRT